MQDAMQGASERDFDLELDFDPIAERFFSQPPAPPAIVHELDDWQPEPLSSLERVAMLTTAAPAMAMLAVATTLLISQPLIAASAEEVPREPEAPALAQLTTEAISAARAPEVAVLPAAPAVQTVAQLPVQPERPTKAVRASSTARRPKTLGAAKRARQLLDAGDASGARELAREAVRSAPTRAAGYIVLAAALDKLGDRAGKTAAFRSCAQLATDALASACKTLARER